jgi:biopolymer transport protein ExbB
MLELLIKGGPVMIPIGLCALAATAIIIERSRFFFAVDRTDAKLLGRLEPMVAAGRFADAEALCAEADTPLARLARTGIANRDLSEDAVKETVQNAANREVPRLERYMNILGTIANIATLLGLLGTVTGNIRAFGVLAATGAMGNPGLLAGAIAEALITTAAGLIVSIPVTVFYNYFVATVNRMVVGMESSVGDLVVLLTVRRPGAGDAL